MQIQTRMAEPLPAAGAYQRRPGFTPTGPGKRQDPLDILEQFGTRHTIRRGQELYAAGDSADYCYRILRGAVRTVGLNEDGRRQIAEFLLAGDLLGFESLGTHHLSAEALTEVLIVRYPRRLIDSLAEQRSTLALCLRDLSLQKLRRAHETMFLLGRKSAGERIATFLLDLAERSPGRTSGSVELPMTRGDIADHLGLTIETVSRTIAQLGRDGTIAVIKCGIEIRDRKALTAHGGGTLH
jgi:CRP/FNR family nitrogen fixation transcriptional regulator